jgi:aminopeptidase N
LEFVLFDNKSSFKLSKISMFTKKIRQAAIIFFLIALFVFSNSAQISAPPQPAYTRARTFDVQHYVIRIRFDRSNKTVFGDTTISLKPLKADFKTLELDAANLKFDTIVLEPQNKSLQYKAVGEKVFVALDKAYSPEELISVRFKYSTAKPKKGVYFIDAQKDDGKITRDAQVWSQGEAEEAHFWFPSYDFPDDKATSEEFITVENGETAIGNGELLETTENADGTRTFHYKMPVAHSSYLTSFIVGKYTKYADTYKNIPLGFYLYSTGELPLGFTVLPDGKTSVPTAYARTKDMIAVYEQLTGVDFPYNKYDQTVVANFQFGGMENITATTMADTEIFYTPEGNVVDLVSHELAHSWFGDLITCKNWSELWLNEGFATFMEAAYREKVFGRADYLRKISEDAQQFMASDAISRNRHGLFFQAARPNEDLFNLNNASITYQKGGTVIHTLREQVGTENFWKAINVYLNRHKFQNVETADLRRAMEEVSGEDLGWFFDQWVYDAGYPKLAVKHAYNPKTKTLNLTVTQTQTANAKTPAAFRLPLNVEIDSANGSQTETIEIKKRIEIFSFKTSGKPIKIRLDADEKIPLKTVKYL